MSDDERIDAWARERRTADVPPGFADRVVEAAVAGRRERVLQVVLVALAGVVGAVRIAASFALFVCR